jgi:hypothetical protein
MNRKGTAVVSILATLGAVACGSSGSNGGANAGVLRVTDLRGHRVDVTIDSTAQTPASVESTVVAGGAGYVLRATSAGPGAAPVVSVTSLDGTVSWVLQSSPGTVSQHLALAGESADYNSPLEGVKTLGSTAEAESALVDAAHAHRIALADVRRLGVLLPVALEVSGRWAATGEVGASARDLLVALASERIAHERVLPQGGGLTLKDDSSGGGCDPDYDPECAPDPGPDPAADGGGGGGGGTKDSCPQAQKTCRSHVGNGNDCNATCGANKAAVCDDNGGAPKCYCEGC